MKSRIATCVAVITLAAWFGCSGEPGADNSYDPNNDRVRPAVQEVTPADSLVAVPIITTISAVMSEDIDILSITSDNIVVLDGFGNIVAGMLYYSGKVISFVPMEKLNSCQKYTVVLTDRIRDLAGNTLDGDYKCTFTTQINFQPMMIRVPGGSYSMGSEDLYYYTTPVHAVTLDAFYLGKTEVTFNEFDEFCTATGRAKPQSDFGRGYMPVVNVTWLDAVDYCNWLSDVSGLERCYVRNGTVVTWDASKKGYRLPTEAEWEYAAREEGITDPTMFSGYWPDMGMLLNDYAWNPDNSGGATHEVCMLNPNQLGFHDMSGNVREWCWDWYLDSYYQACHDQGEVTNPAGPDTPGPSFLKAVRGGAWSVTIEIPTGMRSNNGILEWNNYLGFRVCRYE